MSDARVEWFTVAGSVEAWRAIGLTVTDDGLVPLFGTSLRIVAPAAVDAATSQPDPAGSPLGIVGWSLSGIEPPADNVTFDVDGLATTVVAAAPPVFADHSLGAATLDHVVVSTPDLERTSAAIAAATRHELRRIRDLGAIRQGFHRIGRGGVIIELVEHRDAPAGPAAFWGLVLIVDDIDAACALLGPELVSSPKDAVQPGRQIATLRAEAGLGLPVALMSPDVARS